MWNLRKGYSCGALLTELNKAFNFLITAYDFLIKPYGFTYEALNITKTTFQIEPIK